MNKVFSCAGDCGIKSYHQDTEPIHLNYDDADTVVKGIRRNMVQS